MKKIIKFVLFLLLIIPTSTLALSKDYNDYVGKYYNIKNDEKVNIYLFYSKICPHCQKEEKYFETLKEKYQDNRPSLLGVFRRFDDYSRFGSGGSESIWRRSCVDLHG